MGMVHRWRGLRGLAVVNRRRRLLLERLEGRRLLTVAMVEHQFREDDFSISGSFSYLLETDLPYRDSIPSGSYESNSGHITWQDQNFGQGSFSGIATGDGSDTVRGRACSAYGIEDAGTLGFDVEAANKSLKITENTLDYTIYTYYQDLLNGNCPEPNPPWSRFFGGKTDFYVGEFDPFNSTASISYSEVGGGTSLDIDSPPADVVWANNAPTNLKLTVDIPPPDFELPEGWVLVEQTTDPPENVDIVDIGAGLVIDVEVQGKPLVPRGSVNDAAATIKLSWWDTDVGLQRQEIVIDNSNDLFGIYWNDSHFHAEVKEFPEPPEWANFMKVEVEVIGGEIAADNSKLLLVENFKAKNNVSLVEISEDETYVGLGALMALEDSIDPDIKVYAFNPVSVLGASVWVSSDDGSFVYDPRDTPEIQALYQGEQKDDAMEFIAVKYQKVFSAASHLVFLVGANDSPIVSGEEAETNSDQSVTVNVLANDIDIDNGDVLSLLSADATSALGAQVTKNQDGSVTYRPWTSAELDQLLIGEQLEDSFSYTVQDSYGGTAEGTVTITVNGVREPEPVKVEVVLSQFTVRNTTTNPIPLTVSHDSLDASQLTVTATSLRPDLVADDQIMIGGDGADRTLEITPVDDQIGRAPIQVTVADPNGNTKTVTLLLFIGTVTDQDLDGIDNDMEDQGSNGGDANSDGILDRFQPHVFTLGVIGGQGSLVGAAPEGTFFNQVAIADSPGASGDATGAVFPLGLMQFQLELPAGESGATVTFQYEGTSGALNSAFSFSDESGWRHVMSNGREGVYAFAGHFDVKLLDGGVTDLGGGGDGVIDLSLAFATVVNPWRNLVPYDVNNNGIVQPIDALIIINDLNRNGVRDLSSVLMNSDRLPNFIDVSGDGKAAPIDALIIINWLNRNGGTGEGERGTGALINGASMDGSPVKHDAGVALMMWEAEELEKRRASHDDFFANY